jgi:tetratricopeptide (TPR) repeat protein
MMKKDYIRLLFLPIIILILFAVSNCIFVSQDVREAKDLINVGMYAQAIELLNNRIKKNPFDANAYLLLGECYLSQGNYQEAKKQYDNAIQINSRLSDKVGLIYKEAGDKANSSGQAKLALKHYQEAITYKPDLNDIIVDEAYEQGMNHFNAGEYDLADLKFYIAASLNGNLNREISDLYFNLGTNTYENICIDLFRKSNKYSNHHDNEIGEILIEIAYTKNSEMEIQKWRKEASRYIEVLPDYKECILGSNPFRLKRGEINKFWFRIPLGERLTVSIFSYKNAYEVLNRDLNGNIKIYQIWKGEKLPSNLAPDIKIKALEDIMGKIIIRKKFIDD